MGSRSDWETMRAAAETLEELGVRYETRVVSAHRTPDLLFEYALGRGGRGLQVIVAGAGGAAHLPGMTAAKTHLPVLGVPVESKSLQGHGLAAVDRADAGRRARWGRSRSGAPGAVNAALLAGEHRGAARRGRARAAAGVPRLADRDRPGPPRSARADARRDRRRRASSVRCWRSQASRSAIASACSIPPPDAPAAACASSSWAPYDDPAALDRLVEGADVAHLRVRERAGRGRPGARGTAAGVPALRRRSRPAQDRLAEKRAPARARDPHARPSPPSPIPASLARARRGRRAAPARSRRPGGSATTGRGSPCCATRDDAGDCAAPGPPGGGLHPGGARRVPAGAVDRRGARTATGHTALLPARGERPPRRDPANEPRAGAGRRPSSLEPPGATPPGSWSIWTTWGCWRSSSSTPTEGLLAQRDRAARAQQRPLDDRGCRDQPVREPPPRGDRDAAGSDRPDRTQRRW